MFSRNILKLELIFFNFFNTLQNFLEKMSSNSRFCMLKFIKIYLINFENILK